MEKLYAKLLNIISFDPDYDWMIEIFIVLLVTAMLSLFAGLILRAVSKIMTRTTSEWDDMFVHAARAPLKIAIWILGVYYACDIIVDDKKQAELFQNMGAARDLGIVLMIAWAFNRLIRAGERHFIESRRRKQKSLDLTATNAVSKLLLVAVNISAFLIALQNLGISVDGVLAFGGISGIAVGFAAKDMLANFFGALIIYLDKPFKVGDWIRSPDQEIEGTVEHIGWRMTTIRTFDKRPLYVPNSVFSSVSVENPSRMTNRRINCEIGIRYDDIAVIKQVVNDIRSMLQSHPEIDVNQTLIVNFNAFNNFSCDILIYCFTKTVVWTEYHEVREDVLLRIASVIEKHGAEIAFPTQVEYSMVRNVDRHVERHLDQPDNIMTEPSGRKVKMHFPKDKAQRGGRYGPDQQGLGEHESNEEGD